MKMKQITTALTAAVMAVSLTACSNSADPVGESSQPLQTDTKPQAVHLNLAESWDFQYFYTTVTPEVFSSGGYDITYYLTSFYDTLFGCNAGGRVVGILTEGWSMDEDGKTYTFQIKWGVKPSDGSDLIAEGVTKSILAVPVNLGQYSDPYGRLSTIIEDAVVAGEYTMEPHLARPYYNTLHELCLANLFDVVPSEQPSEDLTAKDTFWTATYGIGPYMYAGNNDGQIWNFACNPNYQSETPDVDSFFIKYIPDNDTEILTVQNGEVDFLPNTRNISAESFGQMGQTEDFQTQAGEKFPQTYYIGYSLNDPTFGDQTARETISSAVDKDAIIESIYGGLYGKMDTFFSRSLSYCDVEQTIYNFDLDRVNQILDEAGYIGTDGDGIRGKDGVKLSASFMYQTGSISDDNLVVYICDQVSKTGIELTP